MLDRILSIENQTDMEREGYKPEYIAALDQVSIFLRLAYHLRQHFRDPKIDPEKVHIPELVQFIDPHIDFMEEGIRNQDSSDKDFRLSQLELLRSEAHSRIETEQVTYRWYLILNLHLALLAHPRETPYTFLKLKIDDLSGTPFLDLVEIESSMDYNERLRIITKLFSKFIDHYPFPEVIMMPTIENLGNIGIISENRTYGTEVHLIGLSNKFMDAHSRKMSPLEYFAHEIEHIYNTQFQINHNRKMYFFTNLFINLFLDKLQTLPKPQRERIELVLYELAHELRSLEIHITIQGFLYKMLFQHYIPAEAIRELKENIQNIVEKDINVKVDNYRESGFLQFMPGHNQTEDEVNTFLQQARSDFIRLFSETAELSWEFILSGIR